MTVREEHRHNVRATPYRPSSRDIAAMLETVGAKSLAALMDEALPPSIRQKAPLDLGQRLSETEALAHMQHLAAQNRDVHLADRTRLFRHDPAGGNPAQHPGKSSVVHGLHALSAGNQPGPAGSAVQFPDHDLRPHRS